MRKPPDLLYGLEDDPPLPVLVLGALQQVAVSSLFLIYPLLVLRAAALPIAGEVDFLRLGMLSLAVAVLLQVCRGKLGSGMPATSSFTAVYYAASMAAVRIGGLPLVWGMTMLAGATEAVLSRAWPWLRPFIPPEISGLVVIFIGTTTGLGACRLLLGVDAATAPGLAEDLVAGGTFALTVALNVWGRGRLRLFSTLLGMAGGTIASIAAGVLPVRALSLALSMPVFAMPHRPALSLAFDPALVVPFAISAVAAAMSTTANLTNYQRFTDADWVRPDMRAISRGLLAEGISTALAGLAGTYGMVVSSSNTGLAGATGLISRKLAFAVAGCLALLALLPVVTALLAVIPSAVIGPILLFSSCFVVIAGMQIIASRMLDGRRSIVIGTSMMAFLGPIAYPAAFASVPPMLAPIVDVPLVIGTIVALALNLVFRLGIRRTVVITLDPQTVDPQAIDDLLARQGAAWGARRDVIDRLAFGLHQAVETIGAFGEVDGPVTATLGFDEFNLDASLTWRGETLELPERRPTPEEIRDSDDGPRRLAGFLMRRNADRVQVARDQGIAMLRFHFVH